MKKPAFKLLAVAAALSLAAFGANAADANVTNNVIFGSGVSNGNFTVNNILDGGVEIGLRARVRFDAANMPTNDNASTGNGTYNVPNGSPTPGFSWQQNSTSTAKWNFDWSVNTDPTGTGGAKIDGYTYLLSMDFDPGVGTNFLTFDPITGLNTLKSGTMLWDHGIGDNTTATGAGAELDEDNAANAGAYASAINTNNLVQNSWNYEFFDSGSWPFNSAIAGAYTILLEAFDRNNDRVSASQIVVNVPEPGSLALIGLALTGLAVSRRRKQAK